MGYVKIWIHAVWTTKNREFYLRKEIRYDVFRHIKEYAASVSKSHIERVRNYIRNQETHHSSQTLDDEIEELFPGSPKPERRNPRAKARGN